jgi:D-aspartate ligase
VLLADATWCGTLAAARDLGARGVKVTLASENWIAPARWSRYVSRTVSCPSSKDAARFLDWLVRFGAEQPGHVLYPTSDDVGWLVAAHSEVLSRSFRLYTPPIKSLIRLLDKARLAEYARDAGLDIPKSCVPRDESEVEWSGGELPFPVYVKPRAQVFGRGVGKGRLVEKRAALLPCWQAQRRQAMYDAEVLNRVPDICSPMLQSYVSGSERIYTVDGFVDETGGLYTSLASVKVLQRPRGSGPGIIFEHAEIDAAVDRGLRALFQNAGYYGIFDAEFMQCGDRKLLIDINPRFYNHMAFEIDRGLPLPWLAYLAATGDREALEQEIKRAKGARVLHGAYVHRLPTALLLAAQRLSRSMSAEDQLRLRHWISEHRGSATDPVRVVDDPAPAVAEFAMEAFALVRHPRSYLQGLNRSPNSA